ncbi:CGNR zinc finger domain-containing protein [Caulobacter segnis]
MTPKLEETRGGFRFRGGRLPLDLPATLAGRVSGQHRDASGRAGRSRPLAGRRRPGRRRDGRFAWRSFGRAPASRDAVRPGRRPRRRPRPARDPARGLNAFAAQPAATPFLDAAGETRLTGGARALLASVAREAVLLLGGPDSAHIRRCQGPTCAILFLDTSRKGDRRWCSMSACGNRAKVAAFRGREKG